MLMAVAIVQLALWQHARHVVVAAAQDGARAARVETGTDDAARSRVLTLIEQYGAHLVTAPQVTVDRTPDTVTVVVTGHSLSVIPGLALAVCGTSTGPVETFRPAA